MWLLSKAGYLLLTRTDGGDVRGRCDWFSSVGLSHYCRLGKSGKRRKRRLHFFFWRNWATKYTTKQKSYFLFQQNSIHCLSFFFSMWQYWSQNHKKINAFNCFANFFLFFYFNFFIFFLNFYLGRSYSALLTTQMLILTKKHRLLLW